MDKPKNPIESRKTTKGQPCEQRPTFPQVIHTIHKGGTPLFLIHKDSTVNQQIKKNISLIMRITDIKHFL